MRPGDMRDWLAAAEAAGEVREVRGADWRLEIGALCELDYRLPHPWALLFDDIVGYPRGRRVLPLRRHGQAGPKRRNTGGSDRQHLPSDPARAEAPFLTWSGSQSVTSFIGGRKNSC